MLKLRRQQRVQANLAFSCAGVALAAIDGNDRRRGGCTRAQPDAAGAQSRQRPARPPAPPAHAQQPQAEPPSKKRRAARKGSGSKTCVCGRCGKDVSGTDGMLMPPPGSQERANLLHWLNTEVHAGETHPRSWGRLMASKNIKVSRSQHFIDNELTPVKKGPFSGKVLTLRHGDRDTQSKPRELMMARYVRTECWCPPG